MEACYMTEDKQRTVLITGANGGIGRGTVAYFAEMGWQVFGVDKDPVQLRLSPPAGPLLPDRHRRSRTT